ncbi:uncharacterized protein [Marmota flaviventris]|uniref:uncharacterized protein n=1 Tax=Marmota flaviventris TaxID=93162 RepID=UPI003A8BFA41
MRRQVGVKRVGPASAGRETSAFLPAAAPTQPKLPSGGGGRGLPIWRRWLTSPEDVAEPARGVSRGAGSGWIGRDSWSSPPTAPGLRGSTSLSVPTYPGVRSHTRDVPRLSASPLRPSLLGLEPEAPKTPYGCGPIPGALGGPCSARSCPLSTPDTVALRGSSCLCVRDPAWTPGSPRAAGRTLFAAGEVPEIQNSYVPDHAQESENAQ